MRRTDTRINGTFATAFVLALALLAAAPAVGSSQFSESASYLAPIPEPDAYPNEKYGVGDTPAFAVKPAPAESGVFGIETSYSGKTLPNGRYADGRVVCTLNDDGGAWGTGQCWGEPVKLGNALDRHGPVWWHVVRLTCIPDEPCASRASVRAAVRGAVGRTAMTIPRDRWKVNESHIERDPSRAGGAGFPSAATMVLSCRDVRFMSQPVSLLEGQVEAGDCHGSLTLRLVKPLKFDGVRLGKLGSVEFSIVAGAPREVRVMLDGARGASRAGIARAVAVERALRARGRLRVEVNATWRDDAGRGRKFRGRATLLAPTRLPHGCRTGCIR